MLDFSKDLVDYADVDSGSVRVGVVIYSTEVEIQFNLKDYKTSADVKAAIDKIPYIYGSTNTADAIETMHNFMFTSAQGDRPDADNVGMVITDGVSNINSRRTIPEAVNARGKGIHVYSVGIGLKDTREVDAIASEPASKNSFNVQSFDELIGLADTIFGQGGSGPCEKPVAVTTPKPAPSCGLSKVDAIIILDASTSVTEANYKKMLEFAKDLVDKADVDSGSVRFGALIYSTEVEIMFHLKDYSSKDDIKAAIDKIPYIYGSTNSADALKTMHQQMFVTTRGDRPDVDNIAFMITDGVSNINSRRTIPEAQSARGKNIHIYAIGIGLKDTRELDGMASEPASENSFNVKEFDELVSLADDIFGAGEACAPDLPPTADAGSDVEIQMPVNFVTLNGDQSTDDKAVVSYMWSLVAGDSSVVLNGDSNAELSVSNLKPGEYEFSLMVADELGQIDEDTVLVRVKAQDFPPTANAGEDIYIQLPINYATLNGNKSSDDIAIVRYRWRQTSGSNTANIRGTNQETADLTNLSAGQYTYALTVYDGEQQSDTDSVNVFVQEQDYPPVANAGADIVVQLPTDYVTIDGSLSSDDVKIVRYRWRLKSGDDSALTMNNDRTPILNVDGLKEGEYTFSLTVVDGEGQRDTDFVIVKVLPDLPPKADAGADITITAPDDIVTLRGDQSTDDFGIVTYDWQLIDGIPSAILEPDGPTADLDALLPGAYTVQLTVTDRAGQSDTDTVEITVLPAPTEATPVCGLDKVDLVFIVDASTSVTEANFLKQLDFMKSIVSYADIDSGSVRVGALIYSTEVEIQFHLNAYQRKGDIIAAIDKIPYIYGSTNTADGLKTMRDSMFSFRNGDRDDVPNTAIIITDGVSNINSRRTIPEAETSRGVGIHIYAVGIGLTDTRELDGLASRPIAENRFAVQDFDELKGLEKIIFTSGDCGVVTTTTPAPTTTTTLAPLPTTPSCGLSKTDLVFILDASTSVTDANFQKMRDFVKTFLASADIDSGSIRVGLNLYSTDVQVEWDLNTFSSFKDISARIDQIPYIYGSTNTADALENAHAKMFVPGKGDRPDAENVIILLTDGVSNINSRRTIPESDNAKAKKIHIYVVGIGLKDVREVTAIASEPASDNLFSVQSFDELVGLEQKIFSARKCDEEVTERPDEPPVADAGRDLQIELPRDFVTLSGRMSTDDYGIVKYEWFQTDGQQIFLGNTEDESLGIYGLQEGSYTFELKVTDALGQTDVDEVEIEVLPEPDLPPLANAGQDQVIQLPTDTVYLSGNQSIDDFGIVKYDWKSDCGARIRSSSDADITASNLPEGKCTFTLTVTDKKGQKSADDVVINVKPELDLPPTADAGQDVDIQLPQDSVTLDGSQSSDDIAVVRYDWQRISGNRRGVTESGNNQAQLNLSNMNEGQYKYRLTVYDKSGQSDSDTVTVNVSPAPKRTDGYDVIFILDSSVSPDHFDWMIQYSKAMIREMSIDDEEFRVGFLIYSTGPYRQFDLNQYSTKVDVQNAVDSVSYRPGQKNTAAALKYVRTNMFTRRAGDRDFAKNFIVLLTGDDESNDPYEAGTEACKIQGNGVGMFSIGVGKISNHAELDAYSSLPTDDHKYLIERERDIGEMPGLNLYKLKRDSPRPSVCPTPPPPPPTTPYSGICKAKGDIVFVLDSSGSVGQENFYRVLNFTYNTIDSLDIDSGHFRVGVTTFSDTSRLDFNLNEFSAKDAMEDALKEVTYMYGNTHTAHALRRARLEMFTTTAGDRLDVQNVLIIITDGQSNVNHELTIPEARMLKRAGVTIITIAVGFLTQNNELEGMTSQPTTQNLIYADDYASLFKLKDQLITPLCSDSNLCNKKPCTNGGTCLDGVRSFVCLCPPDYFGEKCEKRCGSPSDVVIVLDSSNTVGEYNFQRMKEYAQHLVREMNQESCQVNIGFMKYSSAAMVQVYLGMHTDTETNIRALDSISYSRGQANMAAAFRALRTEMFNGRAGDRPNARNIAYFLTDGTNAVRPELAEPEADLTISEGVRIIPIGVGLRDRYELDNIAGIQGINVIEIDDEPQIIEKTDMILQPLYEGNDFCSEDPCRNGGQCVNEPFGFKCTCPAGFSGDTCGRKCSAKGEVVFAVDTSRYVTRTEMKRIRKLLRSIVKRMKFSNRAFSVGMVQFADWAKVMLQFNKGTSKKAVRSSIAGLRVHGSDPQPAQALAKANYRIFNSDDAMQRKPDYLVLITKSMRGEEDIMHEANKLKVQGVRVIGIGLDLTDNEQELMKSVVSMPDTDTAMFADDVENLDNVADNILEYMCDENDHCAENPCQNNGFCKQRGRDVYCECGVGYAGRFCENRCNAEADVVFLLDSSGSVGHDDFRQIKRFVHNMVSDLNIGKSKTRVGLATYSSNSRHGFYMKKYSNLHKLQNAIAGIEYEYGNTNTADGLRLVREYYFNQQNGDREQIQNFLIVLSDGVSNVQPDQTLVEAKLLKEQGVHVYTIGVGDFDMTELNEMASEPASMNAYQLADYSKLDDINSDIIKRTCRDPTVCDENPCRNGGVCVPGINGLFCRCPTGYRGEFCEESCIAVKDFFFLLDSSDSVGLNNWQKLVDHVYEMVETFSGKGSYNRFSLITFSTDVQIVFSLKRYNTLPILKSAITHARYRPGTTNTAGALRTAAEIMAPPLGDRLDAENIVFVITDGLSNVKEEDTVPAAQALKDMGSRVITIAVNMNDYSEVSQMASSETDNFRVGSYAELPTTMEDIINNVCTSRDD